jgi:hypothetical protein
MWRHCWERWVAFKAIVRFPGEVAALASARLFLV